MKKLISQHSHSILIADTQLFLRNSTQRMSSFRFLSSFHVLPAEQKNYALYIASVKRVYGSWLTQNWVGSPPIFYEKNFHQKWLEMSAEQKAAYASCRKN